MPMIHCGYCKEEFYCRPAHMGKISSCGKPICTKYNRYKFVEGVKYEIKDNDFWAILRCEWCEKKFERRHPDLRRQICMGRNPPRFCTFTCVMAYTHSLDWNRKKRSLIT